MDVVNKFCNANCHPSKFYVTIEGEKVCFNVTAINELYDLFNDVEYLR